MTNAKFPKRFEVNKTQIGSFAEKSLKFICSMFASENFSTRW